MGAKESAFRGYFEEQGVWEVYPWFIFFAIHLRDWPLEGMPNGLVFYRLWWRLQMGLAWVRVHTLCKPWWLYGWVSTHCVDLSGPQRGLGVHAPNFPFVWW